MFNGTKVVAAGYRGAHDHQRRRGRADARRPAARGRRSRRSRRPGRPAGPTAGPTGDRARPARSPGRRRARAGPAGPAKGDTGAAARKISVSCKLTGKKKNKVSCTTKQAKGKVTLRLAKAGKTVARGSGKRQGQPARQGPQGPLHAAHHVG